MVLALEALERAPHSRGLQPQLFRGPRGLSQADLLPVCLLERLPIGRRVTDALYVAPGVSNTGVGQANPSLSGSSGLDNLYVIDGVNVTNTGYGAIGSYSIVFGSLGSATPFGFAKEIQVKTGGYEAEFGHSMGGVVNMVTKSGTHQVRGSLFGYLRPEALSGDWSSCRRSTAPRTPRARSRAMRASRWVRRSFAIRCSRSARSILAGAPHVNPPEGCPLESLGGTDRERNTFSYSAKVFLGAGQAT